MAPFSRFRKRGNSDSNDNNPPTPVPLVHIDPPAESESKGDLDQESVTGDLAEGHPVKNPFPKGRGEVHPTKNPFPGRKRAPTTIRLKRQPSANTLNSQFSAGNRTPTAEQAFNFDGNNDTEGNRRRSTSEPQRPTWLGTFDNGPGGLTRQHTAGSGLPDITEGRAENHTDQEPHRLSTPGPDADHEEPARPSTRVGRMRAATTNAAGRGMSRLGSFRPNAPSRQPSQETFGGPGHDESQGEYESEVVDLLDVVDPEVSTLSTLTNVQNSLFIPDLGRWLNRRPTYELTPRISRVSSIPEINGAAAQSKYAPSTAPSAASTTPSMPYEPRPPVPPKSPKQPKLPPLNEAGTGAEAKAEADHLGPQSRSRTFSISSEMSDSRFAVLPHGVSLLGWSEEDKELLNDHVRHMLHSKRSAFGRSMRGFWKYVQKPLGLFVTTYAILITLFGLAWVLFLIGWINVQGRQLYIINVIDNVLVALFAIMGDGLAPFRCVDTYHMIFIAHYHYLSWKLRDKKALPALHDHNDLPTEVPTNVDIEQGVLEKEEVSVLTPKQQEKLDHHAYKYSKSHTFYRPHETETHFAFPVKLLITVTVLLDFHSIFQICLGSVTWSINYHHRPQAATATILCCSLACNISAGIIIAIGDRKTRKKEIIELRFRQALTRDAIKKVQREKRREADTTGEEIEVPVTHAVVTEDDNQSVLDDEHNMVTVVGDEAQIPRVMERVRSPDEPAIAKPATPTMVKIRNKIQSPTSSTSSAPSGPPDIPDRGSSIDSPRKSRDFSLGERMRQKGFETREKTARKMQEKGVLPYPGT